MPGFFCPGFRHDDSPSLRDASELHGSHGIAIWHRACALFDHLGEADSQRGEREGEHVAISSVCGISAPRRRARHQPAPTRTAGRAPYGDHAPRRRRHVPSSAKLGGESAGHRGHGVGPIYERNFQIRLVILDVVPWTTGTLTAETNLLEKLTNDISLGQAEAVVAFVNQCERFTYGQTRLFGRFIVVMTGCYEITTVKDWAPLDAVLSHELAHIFGVFHPARNTVSVMLGGRRTSSTTRRPGSSEVGERPGRGEHTSTSRRPFMPRLVGPEDPEVPRRPDR